MDNKANIRTSLTNKNNITIGRKYALFSDDASIDINNITRIKPLLGIYNDPANEYALISQSSKVAILNIQKC